MLQACRAMSVAVLSTLAMNALAQSASRPVLSFVEVVEVKSQYVRVPCEECAGMPDLRFTGTTFWYRCDGQLYENWTASPLQVGLEVQVVGCRHLVVTKDRKVVVKQYKSIEAE